MTRPQITCLHCKQDRKHHGRGLCHPCWQTLNRQGGIEQYAITRPNRVAEIAAMTEAGHTREEIAEHFGMSTNAVGIVQRRRTRVPDSTWEKLDVPPPPAPAPCTGAASWLFLSYEHRAGEHLIVPPRGDRPRRINETFRQQVEGAFDFCIACPLATREWCANQAVRVKASQFTGVAGGALYSRGKPVWTLDDDHESRVAAS